VINHLILKRTDVAGRGDEAPLDLSKARAYGKERVICCPFHPDQTPSLWMNMEKLCFHCFACEASGLLTASGSGSPPRFIQANWPVKRATADVEQRLERHQILGDALGFYQMQILQAEPYLKARGITLETASHWGCGVCSYQPLASFLEFMKGRGWNVDLLFKHALLRKTLDNTTIASLRGRVIFPLNFEGKLSNLAGRHLLRKGQDLKWLFLKNIQALPKGIFAESNLQSSRVIITESIFDALPWLQLKRPAVALMGVSLPEWMLTHLKGKEVYFALNGDDAGETATRKQLARLIGVAKEIRLIKLPEGYNDWNDYHCDRNRALGLVEAK
jgi:DNA primase